MDAAKTERLLIAFSFSRLLLAWKGVQFDSMRSATFTILLCLFPQWCVRVIGLIQKSGLVDHSREPTVPISFSYVCVYTCLEDLSLYNHLKTPRYLTWWRINWSHMRVKLQWCECGCGYLYCATVFTLGCKYECELSNWSHWSRTQGETVNTHVLRLQH